MQGLQAIGGFAAGSGSLPAGANITMGAGAGFSGVEATAVVSGTLAPTAAAVGGGLAETFVGATAVAAVTAASLSTSLSSQSEVSNAFHSGKSIDEIVNNFVSRSDASEAFMNNLSLPGGGGPGGFFPGGGAVPVITMEGVLSLTVTQGPITQPNVLLKETKGSRSNPKKGGKNKGAKPGQNEKAFKGRDKSIDRFRPKQVNEPPRKMRIEDFKTWWGELLDKIADHLSPDEMQKYL